MFPDKLKTLQYNLPDNGKRSKTCRTKASVISKQSGKGSFGYTASKKNENRKLSLTGSVYDRNSVINLDN